jgi:ABC-type antimicrobial peptide transport system permease subunit
MELSPHLASATSKPAPPKTTLTALKANIPAEPRAAEIGLRAALGASRSRIALWLARRSAIVVLPGILLGAALTAGGLRWTQELLQGLAVSPVLAILFAWLAILVAAGVATLLPALRASRIHPADVLRNP